LLTVVTLRDYLKENPEVNINQVLVMVLPPGLLRYTIYVKTCA
jgi:hypothetical protein